MSVTVVLNGRETTLACEPTAMLLDVLRGEGFTSVRETCRIGVCGTCTVLVDGEPQLSCLVLGLECAGKSVETIEGVARGPELHPLQAAFADFGGSQCGYCSPGVIMTAKALLERNPSPTRDEIRQATAGNLCRCTGYQQIVEAIEDAAAKLREETLRKERV